MEGIRRPVEQARSFLLATLSQYRIGEDMRLKGRLAQSFGQRATRIATSLPFSRLDRVLDSQLTKKVGKSDDCDLDFGRSKVFSQALHWLIPYSAYRYTWLRCGTACRDGWRRSLSRHGGVSRSDMRVGRSVGIANEPGQIEMGDNRDLGG